MNTFERQASQNNARIFLKAYGDVYYHGTVIRPRGQEVRELEGYQIRLDMRGSVCTSFVAREFNLSYAKAEFLWYLRGDKHDLFIERYAKMWPKIRQDGGFYYSNYGQYIFGQGQLDWVIDELVRDRDSRRASIVLLNREHMFADNRDMVCTYSMSFRIRGDKLNMSVNMRSNDVIFGTTNDVFCFAQAYEVVYAWLRGTCYPNLGRGVYIHTVDSLHVYERHYTMIRAIILDGMKGWRPMFVPVVSSSVEAKYMRIYHALKPNWHSRDHIPPSFRYMKWLTDLR